MRKLPRPSRAVRQRRQRKADNHRNRRRHDKKMRAQGYRSQVVDVAPSGRRFRKYVWPEPIYYPLPGGGCEVEFIEELDKLTKHYQRLLGIPANMLGEIH